MQQIRQQRGVAGKVVLVTGASSGIGEAAARAFAAAGARLVLAARRTERLEQLAREIEAAGGEALAVTTDLEQRDQIARLVRSTLDRFGRIDVLANIAGWGKYDWIEEFSPDDLRRQFDVNVVGASELIRLVVPAMKRQRSGHILNMCSYASRIAVPPLTIYASTKYALEGLSDGLRRELAPWGIRVTRIHPGSVTGTEFNSKAGQNGGVQYRSVPIGRSSREQVAAALVTLVERPRREVFIGRLYDLGVFANRRLPGLVDALSAVWVKYHRRQELADAGRADPPAPTARRAAHWAVPAIVSALAFAVVAIKWRGNLPAKLGLLRPTDRP